MLHRVERWQKTPAGIILYEANSITERYMFKRSAFQLSNYCFLVTRYILLSHFRVWYWCVNICIHILTLYIKTYNNRSFLLCIKMSLKKIPVG